MKYTREHIKYHLRTRPDANPCGLGARVSFLLPSSSSLLLPPYRVNKKVKFFFVREEENVFIGHTPKVKAMSCGDNFRPSKPLAEKAKRVRLFKG